MSEEKKTKKTVHFDLPSPQPPPEAENLRRQFLNNYSELKEKRKWSWDVKPAVVLKDVKPIKPADLVLQRELQVRDEEIMSLQWSGDTISPSRKMVVVTRGGNLIVWNTVKKTKRVYYKYTPKDLMCCSYSPSGNFIAGAGEKNECLIYRVRGKNKRSARPVSLDGHTKYVSCCRFLSDSQILTGSCDGTCLLWDFETGQKISTFAGHAREIMCLGVSSDMNYFVTGSFDCTIKTWDFRDYRFSQTFDGHRYDVNWVEYFPGNTAFASASEDNTCKLFDLRCDNELMTYTSDTVKGGISAIAFSPSGRLMYSSCDDRNCYIWDTLKADIVGILKGHSKKASCVGITYDGTALATCSLDSTVRIYN